MYLKAQTSKKSKWKNFKKIKIVQAHQDILHAFPALYNELFVSNVDC